MIAVRTGLLAEHHGVAAPVHESLRLTVPAREKLERLGNGIERNGETSGMGAPLYRVTLAGYMPSTIVLCLIGHGPEQHRGLRLQDEPAYPGEWPEGTLAWHEHGDWVPCPDCGRPLVWYEAAYVPGYRVCSSAPHHHAKLSADGRSAKAVLR
jgi:hypothetical protein